MCGRWLACWYHMEARFGARFLDDLEGPRMAGWREAREKW